MRHAVIGGEEGAIKDAAGISAGEVSGFGDGVEELAEGIAVDREIVDRFVHGGGGAFDEGGLGEHGEDGFGVGSCETFALFGGRVISVLCFGWFGFERRR